MQTLEDAINGEEIDALRKSQQLAILTDGAKAMGKNDLEHLMKGEFGDVSCSAQDIHSLMELAKYRIEHNMTFYPFQDMVLGINFAMY